MFNSYGYVPNLGNGQGWGGGFAQPQPQPVQQRGNKIYVVDAKDALSRGDMPVAVGIGGVTDPVYPLVRCNCSAVTARAIQTRGIYLLEVVTTPTGANFKVKSGLYCAPTNNLASIPVAAAATPTP